jgi:uncharacterized protein
MERHNLLNEFPEYQDKIHQLKLENNHFKKLFDDYHELEHQIHRVNTNSEVVIDEYAHELKSKLLTLKDAIFDYLKK